MPVGTPCPIAPSAAERVRLKKMAYGHETEHRLRVGTQVVLLHAARGHSNANGGVKSVSDALHVGT
ncbi:hypothetical protein [Streptomyces sp. NBC_00299]|uniref:hypothetical protein n=1 Tax=Streptomyces sp. NBC_00299 TaxID=2975705 RepID=UPI002E2C2785|nr:hypothetical protein [Streptomyces sp. NBC_00299]